MSLKSFDVKGHQGMSKDIEFLIQSISHCHEVGFAVCPEAEGFGALVDEEAESVGATRIGFFEECTD